MTDRMHINWDIIVRRLLHESSEEENQLVEKWLAEDEANREYYRKAKHYFDVYYTGEESRKVDSEGAWAEFVTYTDKSSRKFLWKKVIGYAAAVLILFGVGFTYWMSDSRVKQPEAVAVNQPLKPGTMKAFLVFNSGEQIALTDSSVLERVVEEYKQKMVTSRDMQQEKEEYNTLVIPRGGEYNLVLADGTSVKLNSDSKLSFPERFIGKERRVRLEGEALFQVVKDTGHPFIVETENGEVEVLGTVFNVNAYPDEEFVQTTLVEGKVAFQGTGMPDALVITPGEQVTYDKETREADVVKVDTEIYTAWAEGKWIIEGERLENIMKQLARWYDVKVFYQNPRVKDLVFTGDLEKYNNCEVILNIISMTTNVVFEVKDNTITVKM